MIIMITKGENFSTEIREIDIGICYILYMKYLKGSSPDESKEREGIPLRDSSVLFIFNQARIYI